MPSDVLNPCVEMIVQAGIVHFDDTEHSDLPLVSVVVRSMERAVLTEALNSIALQTYGNLEVLVVNAKGGRHHDVKNCGRSFNLQVVNDGGLPLSRPQAANAGLEACRGEFICFLDDDDVFDNDHIESLVQGILTQDNMLACYSGVRCLHRSNLQEENPAMFADPQVDFVKLMLGNVLPIHAVLFPSAVLKHGVRFDETFDCYEDWDFWLQVSMVIPFQYSGRVTATYFSGGDSRVGFGAVHSDEFVVKAYQAVLTKWSQYIDLHLLKEVSKRFHHTFYELSQAHCELAIVRTRLLESESSLEKQKDMGYELRQQLAQCSNQVSVLEQDFQAVITSTSWRLTSPMRFIMTNLIRIKNFLLKLS